MAVEEIRYSVLGPVRAWRGGREIDLGPSRQKAVLVVLLLELNRPVPMTTIIDAVWGQRPPRDARTCVYSYVSRLRQALRAAQPPGDAGRVLASTGAGYLLRGDPAQVDAVAFEQHLAAAGACHRRGEQLAAADNAQAALGLWRGEPLGGLGGPLIEAERARLAELHLACQELRAAISLNHGAPGEVIAELTALVREFPLRERLRELLMVALCRAGRQSDALQVFRDLRMVLAEELGIDPGPELQRLHQRVLTGDPVLASASGAGLDPGSPVPHQLPAGSAHFVGRAGQLRQLSAMLTTAAVGGGTVVISAINGTAGIGKTALAVKWAHQVADRFPGGQLYANLRGFDPAGAPVHPAEALRCFLEAFGVAPERIPVTLDAQSALYRSLLAERQVLVLLDNARDADQVRPLLPASPQCLVLITSRNRLTSLVTAEGAHSLTLDPLSAQEATALLARRVGTSPVAAEPEAVTELIDSCARLPLALAIVAARAAAHPGFPLTALAAELRQASARLDALDAGEPHANLRAVLSWSADALDSQAAEVFGLLGLAPGPDISLPAAASLIAQPLTRTRGLLRDLENAHLLEHHAPDRYRMHDLVGLYAAEYAHHIQPHGSCQAALQRLAGFYIHTAHTGERLLDPYRPRMELGEPVPGCHPHRLPDEAAALAWFDTEHSCLLATQRLAAAQGWHPTVWQLAWTLTTFNRRQGRLHDQIAAWQAGLAAAERLADQDTQALAHRYLGEACARSGNHAQALHHLHPVLTLAEDSGDVAGQAHTHHALMQTWERQGDDQRALEHATRALRLYQALGDPVPQARELGNVGWYHARLGNYHQARAHCDAALTLHRRHHDRQGVAVTLDSLGYVAHHTGRHEQALDYYQQALAAFRDIGDTHTQAETLDRLAETHAALGHHDQARDAWQQALGLYRAQHCTTGTERIQQQLATLDRHPRDAT